MERPRDALQGGHYIVSCSNSERIVALRMSDDCGRAVAINPRDPTLS